MSRPVVVGSRVVRRGGGDDIGRVLELTPPRLDWPQRALVQWPSRKSWLRVSSLVVVDLS